MAPYRQLYYAQLSLPPKCSDKELGSQSSGLHACICSGHGGKGALGDGHCLVLGHAEAGPHLEDVAEEHDNDGNNCEPKACEATAKRDVLSILLEDIRLPRFLDASVLGVDGLQKRERRSEEFGHAHPSHERLWGEHVRSRCSLSCTRGRMTRRAGESGRQGARGEPTLFTSTSCLLPAASFTAVLPLVFPTTLSLALLS